MANNTIKIKNKWKATLSAYPKESLLSLHSLGELLYGEALNSHLVKDKRTKGTPLDHDIICFSNIEYSEAGTGIYTGVDPKTYAGIEYSADELYGMLAIDVSIAQPDARAKPYKIPVESYQLANPPKNNTFLDTFFNKEASFPIFSVDNIPIYEKEDFLPPIGDIGVFCSRGVFYEEGNTSSKIIADKYYIAPEVTPFKEELPESGTPPILLRNEDSVFKGTLSTTLDFHAYNGISLNLKHYWVCDLILKALEPYITINDAGNRGILKKSTVWYSSNSENQSIYNISGINKGQPYEVINCLIQSLGQEDFMNIMNHIYVWVKAPFFGDYIQPDVFNQDLNSNANVLHKNLMLSDTGDFRKWDNDVTDQGLESLKNTLPYIPNTNPATDLISKSYTLENSLISQKSTDINSLIKRGDEFTNKDTFDVGSIRMPAQNFDKGSCDLPNYFNPESPKTAEDYRQYGTVSGSAQDYRIPTIIQQGGNAFIDGRIISPTIDELWIYLKQLTEGRASDKNTDQEIAKSDFSLPRGTKNHYPLEHNKDTRLKDAVSNQTVFKVGSETKEEVYGDIISIKSSVEKDTSTGSTAKYHLKLIPDNYVNNNDTIKYHLFDALTHMTGYITQNPFSQDAEEPQENTRDITNFTAWVNNSHEDTVKDGEEVSSFTRLDEGQIARVDNNFWSPRLEAP